MIPLKYFKENLNKEVYIFFDGSQYGYCNATITEIIDEENIVILKAKYEELGNIEIKTYICDISSIIRMTLSEKKSIKAFL